jgi:hypothetical protein
MAVTRDLLLKIAALASDAGTDEATRAIAILRLHEIHKRQPELFKGGAPPVGNANKSAGNAKSKSDAHRDYLDESEWWTSGNGNPCRDYRARGSPSFRTSSVQASAGASCGRSRSGRPIRARRIRHSVPLSALPGIFQIRLRNG